MRCYLSAQKLIRVRYHGPFGPRRRFARTGAGLWFALLIFMVVSPAAGASLERLFRDDPDLPWEIRADEVEYDMENEVYVARKGVVISKGPKKLTADFVRFDHKKMTALAEGHVMMTTGEDVMTGRRIEISLEDETGTLYDGNIFVKENHFYIRGETIRKVGKAEYLAYKASVTACDGEKPAWKITGRKLDVTVEGYGTVNHAALWFGPVPVIYTPFFIFPAKQKRQSGLLTPSFGISDRHGAEFTQPVYWAINESMDATFYNHYMADRGNKVGLEYRYVLDNDSGGVLMYDFLDDRKVDDGVADNSKDWGYTDDGELRPNTDRYWFRMKADQALPAGFSARLDLDIVSDQDYLKEFKGGYSGFDQTRSGFEKRFSRELDDYTDPVRTNSFTVSKTENRYSLNARMLWYDNVVNRRWKEEDTTLHRLPYVTLNTAKQPVWGAPYLYWNLDSEYTWFYRKDGSRSQRADIYPRFYLPYRFQHYGFAEPSLGLRQTLWYVDQFEAADTRDDRTLHREMADFRLDLYTSLFNIYDLKAGEGAGRFWPDQIRHNLRPQIIYEYVPTEDQDEYPFSDALDRIEKRNRITFALVNTFISKSRKTGQVPKQGADTGQDDEGAPLPDYLYRQFCRFELRQSYDFDTFDSDDDIYEHNLSDRSNPEVGKHLSPLYGKLELTPADVFSISADAEWSHLEGDFRSRNVALSLWDGRGDRAVVEHRYTRDLNESVYANLTVRVRPGLSAYGEYERNLRDDQDIKSGLGILYSAQCWSVNMSYSKEEEDEAYGFTVNLNGLGGIGTN